MKCIYCSTDNNYRDRKDHLCKKCHRHFAFEPQAMPVFALTDPAFKAALESISEKHTLFFTPQQLYYQVLRQKNRPAKSSKKIKLAPKANISFNYFKDTLLFPWIKIHGAPPKLLPEGGRLRPALRQGSEADIQNYSFERLLVCDKAETVDLLLANNLHFETNTPIVSIDGYPQDIFPAIMTMVRRNPALQVFALHDADPQGCLLPFRLRHDSNWFPQPEIQIFDMGLRPRQIAAIPNLIVVQPARWADTLPPPTSPNTAGWRKALKELEHREFKVELPVSLNRVLSPTERHWLAAGYRAELAAFKPANLIRIVYQNFNQMPTQAETLVALAENDPLGFFQTHLPGTTPVIRR